jgi:tRNA pseudouridine55 synthase
MEYLVDSPKIYHTRIKLGLSTDTYDIDGEVTNTKDCTYVTQQMVQDILKLFEGPLEQVPPMYSALKHHGTRLYKLARDGHEVDRPSRPVRIDSIVLTEWDPPFLAIQVQCGRGMYVRSLSHDVGELLECGATVVSLTRLQSGPFHINDSISLETMHEQISSSSAWKDDLKPPDILVQHLKHAVINEGREALIRQGRPFSLDNVDLGELDRPLRIYGMSGNFLALAKYDQTTELWQPTKVLDIDASVSTRPQN